jgi:hypothetical protein
MGIGNGDWVSGRLPKWGRSGYAIFSEFVKYRSNLMENAMNSTALLSERPSGYLIDGTPMFDLRDIAATHGMTYSDCENALRRFIFHSGRPRAEIAAIRAGVMSADDHRFHRVQ